MGAPAVYTQMHTREALFPHELHHPRLSLGLSPLIPKICPWMMPHWGGSLGAPWKVRERGQLVPQRTTAEQAVCTLVALCLINILGLASLTRELC